MIVPVSVSLLTWSHATLVATVQEYLAKRPQLVRCPACGQPLHGAKLGEHLGIEYGEAQSQSKERSSWQEQEP
jgi:hypothetical protein